MKIKQQWFARGFQIGHQKVFVDVDFATKTIEGWTEISIIPLSATIDSAAFHCWQSEILNCEVDGQGALWQHIDGLPDLQLKEPAATVHQHETLRKKFLGLNRTINKCDLHVKFPAGVRAVTLDHDGEHATHNIHSSGANENGNEEEIEVNTPAVMPTPMTPFGNGASSNTAKLQYRPITVKIWFRCIDPVLGLRFLNCDGIDHYPHMYTTNHPVPCSTSLWCPCLDGIWERSTWEFSVSVPKTLGAIARRRNYSTNGAVSTQSYKTQAHEVSELDQDIFDTKDALAINVICSADFVDEKTNPYDPSRKILSFAQGSPVGAGHMAFSVGPFQQYNLSELREPEEDDLMGSSAVDVHVSCLPGCMADAKTTCFPVYKAMDFFVKEYGSYPFNNYHMVFVEDLEIESATAAGMSFFSQRLIYDERNIEAIHPVTKRLVFELASQWIGVNIVPRSWSDTWLIIGLAYYLTGQFLRKLMGNNDYRFRLKQDMIRITEEDIAKPPLSSRTLEIPIDPRHLSFICLKAPVVLHLLEQKLTRAGSNLGLGRVIPRIFLQALSGELPNGILSTEKFLKQCEKLAHIKLEEFAKQWIFGHGYPRFSIVQRFNKKKMVIEMGIRQQQFQDSSRPLLRESSFVDDAYRNMTQTPIGPVEAVFTGAITIRIHEADGTPYEHVIDLKDQYHKFDIPYNNKYRKRFRNRKPKTKSESETVVNGNAEEAEDDVAEQDQIHCLGDGFQAEMDHDRWRLEDWSKEDEDKMSAETFEWIRVDSGFEWICTMQVGQPDYMYHSQLQQDRDVVAQLDAVQYFAGAKPSAVIATILFRTVMDERYYYGIRQSAARALANCATSELNFVGQEQLIGIFRKLYCFDDPGKIIPEANDFHDFANYFLRRSLIESVTSIRMRGYTSAPCRSLILNQLRHNDNSENEYDDSDYLCHLITCLVDSLIHSDPHYRPNLYRDREIKEQLDASLDEIERFQRMDRWRPSYQNIITRTIIAGKERLMQAGMLPTTFREFMDYTREDHYVLVRHQALRSMLNLGALRSPPLSRYLLFVQDQDASAFTRHQFSIYLQEGIGAMALRGKRSRYGTHSDVDAMIIEEDTTAAVELRKDRESRSTLEGAMAVLRQEFDDEEVLKEYMWKAANNWRSALLARRNLLDICKVMYETRETRVLKFKIPSMKTRLMCFPLGRGKLVMKKGRPCDAVWRRLRAVKEAKGQKGPRVNSEVATAPKPLKIKLKIRNIEAMRRESGYS